jgi:hypothetical protein
MLWQSCSACNAVDASHVLVGSRTSHSGCHFGKQSYPARPLLLVTCLPGQSSVPNMH